MSGKLVIIDIIALLVGGYGFAQTVRFPADLKQSFLTIAGQQYPWIDCRKRGFYYIYTPDVRNTQVSVGGTALSKGKEGFWIGTTGLFDPVYYYQLVIDGFAVAETADRNFNPDYFRSGIKNFCQPKNIPHEDVNSYWYFSKITNVERRGLCNFASYLFHNEAIKQVKSELLWIVGNK